MADLAVRHSEAIFLEPAIFEQEEKAIRISDCNLGAFRFVSSASYALQFIQ